MHSTNYKQKMMSSFSKITVVIFSYERPNFLKRSIKYWAAQKVNLIVLDGSKCPLQFEQKKFDESQLNYIHSQLDIYGRIKMAIDLIKTEYVILACDDEFYLPSALGKCIEELDANKEVVACCGQALGFSKGKNLIIGESIYTGLRNYKLDQLDPIARAVFHMTNYNPAAIYSVCRTKAWKHAWSSIIKNNVNNHFLSEIQFEIYICFTGKIKVLDHLMWLRSINEGIPSNSEKKMGAEYQPFEIWWQKTSSKDQKQLVISECINVLKSLKNTKRAINRLEILNIYDSFVEGKKIEKKGTGKILQYLKNKISKIFSAIAHRHFEKFFLMENQARKLEQHKQIVNWEELKIVVDILENFHSLKSEAVGNDKRS